MRDPLLRLFERFLHDREFGYETSWDQNCLVVHTERGAVLIGASVLPEDDRAPNTCSFFWKGCDANRKIQAIKCIRAATNWGLKEAKDFVDRNESGARICTVPMESAAHIGSVLTEGYIAFDQAWPTPNPLARKAAVVGLTEIKNELEGDSGDSS